MRGTLILVTLIAATGLCVGCRRASDVSTTADVNDVNAAAKESVSAAGGAPAGMPAQPTAAGLPPCAQAGPMVSLPPEFPQNFPLPPGTAITVSRRAEPALVVQGFIPMELKEATKFFVQNLPAAGFQLGRGEAERDEADARFGGYGMIGLFKIRRVSDCPGALELTIRIQSIDSIR